MIKQIPGQMSMLDFCQDATGFSIGEQYRWEGYTNAYDQMPDHECEVDVIDHEGHRFRSVVKQSFGSMVFDINRYGDRGYDICWWREVKTRKKCGSCAHFHEVVSGPGDIYHGTACLKDRPWAHFKEPEDPACEYYEIREEAIDG